MNTSKERVNSALRMINEAKNRELDTTTAYALTVAASLIKEMQAENTCDCCLGEPLPDNAPCMCKGTGKMSEAVYYLREQLLLKDHDNVG